MNVSFVIPCYNCENYISKNINSLNKKLKNSNLKYEIILIDDFSYDDTLSYLNNLRKKIKNIKLLKNHKNHGKSFSIIKGIKASKYKYVVFIDCDFPYFKSIFKVIGYLRKNDMVIINRRKKNSKLKNKKLNLYQLTRILLGYLINNFIRIWFGIKIKDTQAGLKAFIKPKNFSKINFISKRFFFDLELILIFISAQKKIFSLKTIYSVNKKSSINFFDLGRNFEILFELIKICFNYKFKNEKTYNILR